jgi:hypothetical protein
MPGWLPAYSYGKMCTKIKGFSRMKKNQGLFLQEIAENEQ